MICTAVVYIEDTFRELGVRLVITSYVLCFALTSVRAGRLDILTRIAAIAE